jgi:hypothetical protein
MLITELHLPNGGRWDIWLTQLEYIGKFVQDFKLKPVAAEHLVEFGLAAPVKAAVKAPAKAAAGHQILWDPGIRGGIRVSHLHYKGEVYLLNARQWETFSKKVIADALVKLANVKAVSFDNLVQFAGAVEGMH